MFFDEWPDKPQYVVCDRDTKFTDQFKATLEYDGIELKRVAVRAPNQNAYAERWVQSIQQECLDHFVILDEAHLRYLVQEYVRHYNQLRPHQSKDNLPLSMKKPPESIDSLEPDEVVCHQRLGGLLKFCERKAA